ncbi:MAG: GAF domain-containing protein [Anaerolineae bacterium]|nr:GAF domain-containing protein [Anaerolineae bacterium]
MTAWLTPALVSGAVSLAILVTAYGFMWLRGRQASMELWGSGWAAYALHFVSHALVFATGGALWRFVSLAALGISSLFLYAGSAAFVGRPMKPTRYAWVAFPALWALFVFFDLSVDPRLVGIPLFIFVGLVDLQTARLLLRHVHLVEKRPSGGLAALFLIWTALKLTQLLVPLADSAFAIIPLLANGLALGLAFFFVAASLIEAEREARRRAERLKTLTNLSITISRILSPDEMLRAALDEFAALLGADTGLAVALAWHSEDDPGLEFVVGRGLHPDCHTLSRSGACACNVALQTGQIVSPQGPLLPPPMDATACPVNVAIPLATGDRIVGAIAASLPPDYRLTDGEMRTLEAIGRQVGIALANARLYKELEGQTEKLHRAFTQLEQLDQLRNQIAQNVSHELRTPLTLIQGYTELLVNGDLGTVSPAQQDALETIHDRAVALSQIVYTLTSLQALPREALALRPLLLAEVVEELLGDYAKRAERAGVHFERDFSPGLPPIMVDRDRLRLALLHLIDNAIKFSPGGGRIWVRVWRENSHLYVSIKDEGVGIAPEHMSMIFERFYQADGSSTRRFGGMGVGLALVWEVVEAHGGGVSVDSEPGKGSTFTVSIPIQGAS